MNINKNAIKLIYIGLIVLLCALIILIFYQNIFENKTPNYVNILRLDSNQTYEVVSELWPLKDEDIEVIKKEAEQSGIFLTIVNLDETIIFTNSHTLDITSGKTLLDALYMDKSYMDRNPDRFKISQPIYNNNQVAGFVIFEKVYDFSAETSNLGKQIVIGMMLSCLVALLFMTGFLLFSKNKNELKAIEDGLRDISKGVLQPIPVAKDSGYKQIYLTFNMLVEELTHIMKQQQSYEGQRKAFLTMISHELKTPIATINAYVEGLICGVAEDDETKEKYLAIISDKMHKLTKQVEDFFEYAQDKDNRFKYNFEECYADEVIEKIFSGLASSQRQSTKVQNLLPKCIFNVDKIRMEQVIMNLYNNALKHTTKEESIVLKAYREDSEVVIEIEDKGEGISPKDLPYIFDYYYQGQASKKRDYEGVGLGLAICKNIVDSHKGKIMVKSKEGQGTTMYIRIPLV